MSSESFLRLVKRLEFGPQSKFMQESDMQSMKVKISRETMSAAILVC